MIPDNSIQRKETILAPFRPDEESPYIFISYSHKDRDRVFPIITRLYEKGWHVWYDEGLEITENYYTALSRHIKNCTVFLLFVTKNSVKSEFVCEHELLLATTARKRIALCYLDPDARFTGEAKDAIDIAAVSKKNPKTDEAGLEAALDGIEELTRFEKRTAVGFKILQNVGDVIEAVREDDEYEYEKCEGGVRLTRYLGKNSQVIIPREYKNLPVRELVGTFDNSSIDSRFDGRINRSAMYEIVSVKVPPTVTHIGDLTFFVSPDTFEDLYLPASVRYMSDLPNCFYGGTRGKFPRFHCAENSYAHLYAQRYPKEVTEIILDPALDADLSEEEPKTKLRSAGYVFCSYANDKKEDAERIIRQLTDKGCSAALSLPMTEKEKIRSLRKAGCMIAFISQEYIQEEETEYLYSAIRSNIKYLVYALDNTALPDDFEILKGSEQQLRFDSGTEADRIAKLVNWLSANGCREGTTEIPDFDYITGADKGLILKKYTGHKKDVIVPAEHAGYPVIKLEGTFENSDIVSATIPYGIKYIGARSFFNCKNLRSITLPESVIEIGNNIDDGLVSDGFVSGVFTLCESLTAVNIPKGVKAIGKYAFAVCTCLSEVVIPDTVAHIRIGAFRSCKLKEIVIPESVESIETESFGDNKELRSFTVRGKNTHIARYAFSGCPKDLTVYCHKGSSAWNDCKRFGIRCKKLKG